MVGVRQHELRASCPELVRCYCFDICQRTNRHKAWRFYQSVWRGKDSGACLRITALCLARKCKTSSQELAM